MRIFYVFIWITISRSAIGRWLLIYLTGWDTTRKWKTKKMSGLLSWKIILYFHLQIRQKVSVVFVAQLFRVHLIIPSLLPDFIYYTRIFINSTMCKLILKFLHKAPIMKDQTKKKTIQFIDNQIENYSKSVISRFQCIQALANKFKPTE